MSNPDFRNVHSMFEIAVLARKKLIGISLPQNISIQLRSRLGSSLMPCLLEGGYSAFR